jgi:hypothetical protein
MSAKLTTAIQLFGECTTVARSSVFVYPAQSASAPARIEIQGRIDPLASKRHPLSASVECAEATETLCCLSSEGMSVRLGLSVWSELPFADFDNAPRANDARARQAGPRLTLSSASVQCTGASGPVISVRSSDLLPQNRKQGAEAAAIILYP